MYRKIQNDPEFLEKTLSLSKHHHNHKHDHHHDHDRHHILFDCDGLILDTEPIYSQVALQSIRHFLSLSSSDNKHLHHHQHHHHHNQHANQEYHETLFPHSLKLKVMGGDKFQVAQFMAEHVNTLNSVQITAQDWSNHTEPLETELFTLGCNLMPYVKELVDSLVKKGWLIAVATSSSRHCFTIKSAPHSSFFSSFPVITCGDDPDFSNGNCHNRPVQGKPHPSIFSTARHHLNRLPSQPGIALEDSPNGVVAALRSGHSCIWVPAESVQEGFDPIDEISSKFPNEIDPNLFVYRAKSLKDLLDIIS